MTKKKIKTAVFRPDSADGSKDFKVPADIAKELFDQGIIGKDTTNGGYCPIPTYVYDMTQHKVS